jgi:hypothetical protein
VVLDHLCLTVWAERDWTSALAQCGGIVQRHSAERVVIAAVEVVPVVHNRCRCLLKVSVGWFHTSEHSRPACPPARSVKHTATQRNSIGARERFWQGPRPASGLTPLPASAAVTERIGTPLLRTGCEPLRGPVRQKEAQQTGAETPCRDCARRGGRAAARRSSNRLWTLATSPPLLLEAMADDRGSGGNGHGGVPGGKGGPGGLGTSDRGQFGLIRRVVVGFRRTEPVPETRVPATRACGSATRWVRSSRADGTRPVRYGLSPSRFSRVGTHAGRRP